MFLCGIHYLLYRVAVLKSIMIIVFTHKSENRCGLSESQDPIPFIRIIDL